MWYLRDNEGEVKYPADFKVLDARSKIYLDKILHYSDFDDSFLDVGCNCGRHLNFLAEKGYKHLSGFDISANSLVLMKEWFPGLAELGEFRHSTFGSYFLTCKSKSFDFVITYGATIENCNPSLDIVAQMCRVARKYIVVNISIDGHSYPRMWQREFERNSFKLVEQTACVQKGRRIPTLVFKNQL